MIDTNPTVFAGLGGLAATFSEVAEVSLNVLGDEDAYVGKRVGVASAENYWFKFGQGAMKYFMAPVGLYKEILLRK